MRSPLLGYNHNLKYRGRVYHVQTEDSGESNPHIFTHLFHNGIILATRKTEYVHLLGADDVEDQVRKLMQVQHKDMMKGLLGGQYDEKIVRYFGELVGPDVETAKEPAPVKDSALAKETPKEPEPALEAARVSGQAKPITSHPFQQEDTLLGMGQTPSSGATMGKTSTTPLREQSVSALGPSKTDAGKVRPQVTPEPEREQAPSVVIARPAIILTGDEPSFGSFTSPNSPRPTVKKPEKQIEMFEHTDTFLELNPVGARQVDEAPLSKPEPPRPAARLTGPVQAPPGLFKPEKSKHIPDELMTLENADNKVDDIILDFLMAESLSKLPDDDESDS